MQNRKDLYYRITIGIFILLAIILLPNSNWKKVISFLSSSKNIATAFESAQSGNWNDSLTWGITHNATTTAHYKLNDSASTTDVIDAIGGNTGTAATNTENISIAGKINQALTFDGLSDYIRIPQNADLNFGTSSFSQFMWIRTTGNGNFVTSREGDPGLFGVGTAVTPGHLGFYDGANWYDSGIIVNDGAWHHVGLTRDGTNYNFYVDNVAVPFTGNADLDYSGYVNLGASYLSSQLWVGDMDDVRFYNAALTSGQVAQIYNSGNGTESELDFSFSLQEGVDYPGQSDNVEITDGQTIVLTEDQSVKDISIASGGELNLDGHTLNIYGNWTNNGGTLSNSSTTASSTVNFAGTSTQRIFGENTFENLTKNSSTSSSLFFDSSATTTVTGILSLSGVLGNLLSIGPANGYVMPVFDSIIVGTTSEPFQENDGIANDSLGNVYVSDRFNNDIQEFSATGTFVKFLDVTGLNRALDSIYLLAVDSHDNIYAVDFGDEGGNGRIVKFDSSGLFSTTSPSFHTDDSIAVDSDGNMYFGDYAMSQDNLSDGGGNNEGIVKLAPDFTVLATTTAPNGMDISFNWNGLSINGNYLYFADDHNNRIVKLNKSDLSFVSESFGPAEAPFNNPSDVHVDSSGNINVYDAGNNRIIKLSPDYVFLTQFNNDGIENGQFSNAYQFSIDSNDNIYVADAGNQRVQKFTPSSGLPFTIVLDQSGTSSFSYLSVSGSINGSENATSSGFDCTNGCVNGGSYIGWTFPTPPVSTSTSKSFRRRITIAPVSEIYSNSNDSSQTQSTSTLTATSTHEATSTMISSPIAPSPALLGTNLLFGTISGVVKSLQIFLNTHGYLIAKSGAGSLGKETSYFGQLTKAALIRFQKAYKLPPTGFFGPMTRALINGLK